MDKQTKIILIAVLIIALIFLLVHFGKPKLAATQGGQDLPPATLLKRGSRGDAVAKLQAKLNQFIAGATMQSEGTTYYVNESGQQYLVQPLTVDGIFGTKTEAMLMDITGYNSVPVAAIDSLVAINPLFPHTV